MNDNQSMENNMRLLVKKSNFPKGYQVGIKVGNLDAAIKTSLKNIYRY